VNTLTGQATTMDKTWGLGVINDFMRMGVNYATPFGLTVMAVDFGVCMVLDDPDPTQPDEPGGSGTGGSDTGDSDTGGPDPNLVDIPDISIDHTLPSTILASHFIYYIDDLTLFDRENEPADT